MMSTVKKTQRVRQVPAVSRAAAILRLLANQREPMGVKAISDTLGMVTSTTLHIVRVLVDERLLHIDPATKRYMLGPGLLTLARSVQEANVFVALVQPSLNRLAEKWGLSMAGVEITGPEMLVVTLSQLRNSYRLHIDVGARFPALAGSTGRLVAAFNRMPVDQLRSQFKELQWHEPPTFSEWSKEVEAVKRKGYSLDKGNDFKGVFNLAVPILNTGGQVTHSIVAGMLGDHLTRVELQQLVSDMTTEAQAVSVALHGAL